MISAAPVVMSSLATILVTGRVSVSAAASVRPLPRVVVVTVISTSVISTSAIVPTTTVVSPSIVASIIISVPPMTVVVMMVYVRLGLMHRVPVAPCVICKHGRTARLLDHVRSQTPKDDGDAALTVLLVLR
jgi:hypothetical protein